MMLEDILRQASLSAQSLAALLRRLAVSPWIHSVDLTVTVVTGATSATALHGLGRTANGAAVVGATDASRTISVDLPSTSLDTVTVRLSSAAASDFQIKLRVY